ncbi:MAG: HAD family hydrolase [Betaproteobacteria bacterium]|nr:MAG: HAD family hydrolase [Betaproteobacteria bacterium]
MAVRAVFVDKDGTLVHNVPYNVDPARIALTQNAAHAVRELAARGFSIFVVSNQPGAALGLFPEEKLRHVEGRLRELLPALDGFYYCPHAPDTGCGCRKPAAGLLERAAREHAVDLGASWMVGDILDDVEAGRRAGCRTILVDNGNETEWRLTEARAPHHVAGDLAEAAAIIAAAS